MVELGEDASKCDKNVKCFTMDEAFLNDLLECSVCLDQLDSSSKVLPCQHTFCKRCLQEIVNSHKELRCPECRILVETKIDDLPCNILLVRLLEGIKNNVRPKRILNTPDGGCGLRGSDSVCGQIRLTPPHPQLPHPPGILFGSLNPGDLRTVPKQVLQPCPCAKALYPYEAKVPGDLTFKKGDTIILRKRVDQNWFYGELGGKSGFVPAGFVQVVVPIPTHVPQCKALFDFQISNSEEKDCLTFGKGDILTVIRRIDDHWAEGKLRERIGIFPISFVEMNAAARAVMKLSVSIQPGSSRILPPPAPSTESHFTVIQSVTTTSASGVNTTQSAMCQETLSGVTATQPILTALSPPFSSSAFTSPSHVNSIIPQHSMTNPVTEVQSCGVVIFPGTSYDGHIPGPQTFTPGPSHHRQSMSLHQQVLQTSGNPKNSDDHNNDCVHEGTVGIRSRSTPSPGPIFVQSSVATVTPPVVSQRSESMSCAQTSQQNSHTETVIIPTSHLPTAVTPDVSTICHTPARNVSGGHPPPTHVPVPTFYLALYSYRPQKDDELELRKGELYTVSEKCQDGWFKGTSLRTGHSGVFPGNYVQLAKSAVLQPHIMTSPAGQTSPSTSPPPVHPVCSQNRVISMGNEGSAFHPTAQGIIYTNSPTSHGGRSLTTSPSPISLVHPAVSEWAHSVAAIAAPLQRLSRPVSSTTALSPSLYKTEAISKQNGISCNPSRSPSIVPWSTNSTGDFGYVPCASTWVTDFPTRTTSSSPTRMLSYQASSSVSVGSLQMASQNMIPGNSEISGPRYSISQPSTPLMMPHTLSSTSNTNPFVMSAPDRLIGTSAVTMAPCSPSTVIASQTRMDKHKEKKEKEIVSLMKRLTKRKSKSPPPSDYSCDNPSFVDAASSSGQSLATVHVRSTSCPSEALGIQSVNHKKTGSLDGSGNSEAPRSSSRPKQPAPLVRERFRCIVPYPPNGDYELELKVGDIVYVHKKREDGWYKGTLQRTGKTGLFPSSFVEGF